MQRLKHLERKGVIELWPSPTGRGNEYRLTPAGKALEPVLMALGRWSVKWLFDDSDPTDVDGRDADVVDAPASTDASSLPAGRVVIQFDHTAPKRQACGSSSTGVRCRSAAAPRLRRRRHRHHDHPELADVFSGASNWSLALSSGAVRIDGPPRLVKALPRWFQQSPFAPAVRAKVRGVKSARPAPARLSA